MRKLRHRVAEMSQLVMQGCLGHVQRKHGKRGGGQKRQSHSSHLKIFNFVLKRTHSRLPSLPHHSSPPAATHSHAHTHIRPMGYSLLLPSLAGKKGFLLASFPQQGYRGEGPAGMPAPRGGRRAPHTLPRALRKIKPSGVLACPTP